MEANRTKDSVTMLAVGDIMPGDSPVCFGFGVGSMIEKHGPEFPFVHVRDTLRGGDIVIGNLEVPLSRFDRHRDSLMDMQFKAQPESVEGLVDANFHLLSLATNHTMQHGRAALEETLEILRSNNIDFTGVEIPEKGIHNECFLERKGMRFCFLNYNFRPQQYFVDPPLWRQPSAELIKADIDKNRAQAEYIVISLHWGDEFIDYPSPEQVVLARELIDAGADVILGHHPHTVQGVESYNGGVIAYSLGNFVFDMWQIEQRKSMILKVEFTKGERIAFDIMPIVINMDHQPDLVHDREAVMEEQLHDLAGRISADLSSLETYSHDVGRNLKRYRREVHRFYLTHLHRYDRRHLFENIKRVIRNRLGK